MFFKKINQNIPGKGNMEIILRVPPVGGAGSMLFNRDPALVKDWYILAIQWSYSAAPTGGRLTIAQGANTILDLDIVAAGPDSLDCCIPIPYAPPVTTITLAAGGAGIFGKLNGQWMSA